MRKRWVVASVSALALVAATMVVAAVTADRTTGTAVAETTIRPDDGQAIGQAATTPPVTTSPSTTSSAGAPPGSAPTTTTAPPTAPLAGRIEPGVTRSGVATFYDADGGGACLYDPSPDPLTAAMNWADYEGSQACGAYVLVQAANGASVTVRITNLCPQPCRVGQLDLSPEAFDHLAARGVGEIPISWTLVSPALSKRIAIRYKTGSSRYWCGVQVIDHRNPVARLEVLTAGGWTRLPRAEYNYFLSENGAGCGGAIAITDVHGERLVLDPLPVEADVTQPTTLQFAQH